LEIAFFSSFCRANVLLLRPVPGCRQSVG
jgi:hypothetical protein